MKRKISETWKAVISVSASVLLLLAFFGGRYLYRQSFGFTGEIISWSTGHLPYEVHNLPAGTALRLSAKQYSKKYEKPGYKMTNDEGTLTITVYEDGQQVASFSTPQYSFSQPVWMDDRLYFIAYESPDRDSGPYLWEYRDG